MTRHNRLFSTMLSLLLILSPGILLGGPGKGKMPTDRRKVVERVIKPLSNPLDVVWAPDSKSLYLTEFGTGNLALIRHNKVERRVKLGRNPTGIDISPDGRTLYVALAGENVVLLVDRMSMKVTRRVKTCKWPIGLRVSRDGRFIATACYNSNQVNVLSTHTFTGKTVNVGSNPFYLVINRAMTRIFVSNHFSRNISELTLETANRRGPIKPQGMFLRQVRKIQVGNQPTGLCFSADGRKLFVANFGSSTVSQVKLEGERTVKTLKVLKNPYFVAVEPATRVLFVSHQNGGPLHLFYPNGKRTQIHLKKGGVNMRFSPDGKKLALSDYVGGMVNIAE